MTQPTITLKSAQGRIEFCEPSGTVVAFLRDGDAEIMYDPLADTEEALGLVDYRQIIADSGLTTETARAIVAAGKLKSINPESVPEAESAPDTSWQAYAREFGATDF